MFHMTARSVEATLVVQAVRQLGWQGQVAGPVRFGGLRFWAVADLDLVEHDRRLSRSLGPIVDRDTLARCLDTTARKSGEIGLPLRLAGCLVVAQNPQRAARDASLLAAYAPRAVLVPDACDVLGLLVDAAVLDLGVVCQGAGGMRLLMHAGPRVVGGEMDAREWELLERVYGAVLGTAASRSDDPTESVRATASRSPNGAA